MILVAKLKCGQEHLLLSGLVDWPHQAFPSNSEASVICDELLQQYAELAARGVVRRDCPHCGEQETIEWNVDLERAPFDSVDAGAIAMGGIKLSDRLYAVETNNQVGPKRNAQWN